MNYIIERFDQVINSLISTDRQICNIRKEDVTEIIREFAHEKEKVRLFIMEEVFSSRDTGTLELLIDKYQSVFIRLLDQLYFYRQANKKQDEYRVLSKALYDYLNELLCFLQINYSKYFNRQQKIPFIKREHLKRELRMKLDTIKAAYKQTILTDHLLKIILLPFENLLMSNAITFAEADYLKSVSSELLSIDTIVQDENLANNLKILLISINYNSQKVSNYLIEELDNLISEEESVQGKLRILKYHLKEVNKVIVKIDASLYPKLPGLKEQLTNWLNEEISFYHTEQLLIANMSPGISAEAKIHTSFSVPQLALIFRLLKEERLITNTNQSELLRVVSNCFTTMSKESFSYGHLHGTYYKIEQHTKRSVYDMLIRLLHLSKKIS